ncbi:hypothetical protein AAMO2058_000298000 [Amorphochlora amoebiformis]|mmetsp:Transcript_7220/g.11194  ORF Transcript_7220/g.11194 Transcript_7220/m.11194 type:complete len:1017 (-) Transcript_7220:157-3207(-)
MQKWAKYRSSFPPLTFKPLHLDLLFDVRDDVVKVTQVLSLRNVSTSARSIIELDAMNLINIVVMRYHSFKPLGEVKDGGADFPAHVASLKDLKPVEKLTVKTGKITIELKTPVPAGEEFVLRTENLVKPTANILEGIYYDYTLPDMPKSMITQCQQYGFQRIVPAVDRMNAKAFFTTTIIADKRYTNMISNGDLAPGFWKREEKTGAKIAIYQDEKDGDPKLPERKVIKYYNHKVNMASYLFFFGCGVYETYTRTLEYPDGDVIDLQLLSLPTETNLSEEKKKRRTKQHMDALESLHDSVLWTYVSTGPETCEHKEERSKVYALIKTREKLKEDPVKNQAELVKVRKELKEVMSVWKNTGYKYTGQTYREIGMQNSNYGGMENVGNTTILQSRLAPSDAISDGAYMYMHAVKIHEFYHNINGSQVTGYSPFEIWLNEAVTVHMERLRSQDIFGKGNRLSMAARAFIPGSGPLASDSGPRAMPVEPEGFNLTNELITGMTYFKAPEFVRMIELCMGSDLFYKGLHRYHETYKNANATSIQWIEAMEDTMKDAGKSVNFKAMAHGWLKRSGHPKVDVSVTYDEKQKMVSVEMKQSGFQNVTQKMDPEEKGGPWDIGADFKAPWIFPVEWGLVKDGKDLCTGMFTMSKDKEILKIEGVESPPDFFSFARGFSFFGTYTVSTATSAQLVLQARTDPDLVNRFIAYRAVADKEKARLVELCAKGKKLSSSMVSKDYTDTHAAVMFDEKLEGSARSMICMENESLDSREDLKHLYWEMSAAKDAMLAAVYKQHEEKILKMFDEIEGKNVAGPHKDQLHDRAIKGHLLRVIVAGAKEAKDTKKAIVRSAKLMKSMFMSDRIRGISTFLSLEEPVKRDEKIAELKKTWGKQIDMCETLISIISSIDSKDSPKIIGDLIKDDIFDINLAGHSRQVVRNWAHNRKRCVLTDDGLDFSAELLARVGKVNQMSVYALLDAFGDLNKFSEQQKRKMLDCLKNARSKLDPHVEVSLYNQIGRLISAGEKS